MNDIELIINIEDSHFKEGYQKFEGIIITTDKQKIFCGIKEGQSCCEDSGYLLSHDSESEFIGSRLLGISLTDAMLASTAIKLGDDFDVHEGGVVFINFETSAGTLQFVAYNDHNGYYGHTVVIKSKQFQFETSI